MSRRRGSASIAANPVLIGAATTLVVIVAIFLSYNANNGLPFVPTYDLTAQVPSAANLVKGNEVRIGGTRVGVVTAITPRRLPNGGVIAQLQMKLDTAIQPLKSDSTLIVRPKSALGLKYVEITEGKGGKDLASGSVIPIAQSQPAVEIDDVFNTFDEATRAGSQRNLAEFGNAFAGRGQDLNDAIKALGPLLTNLVPVMRNLADRRTRLAQLFPALARAAAEVAPVAETQAELFRNLDTTFTALAEVARPFIQDSISTAPPFLEAGIRGFPVQRPFIRNTAAFFRELRPGIRSLRGAAPDLADALVIGTPTLRRSVALNRRLEPLFEALRDFNRDPQVPLGIRRLTETVGILNPIVADLTPTQTVCNYVTLWFRNVSSLLSEGDANGTWQRFIILPTPQGPNNEGGPSSAPANGPSQDNHLHANPYPNTAQPGAARECEAGSEKYAAGRTVLGNPAGVQATSTEATKP